MPVLPEPVARAYAVCAARARSHYENFPVASRVLPAPMRPHVAAVYAFARVADDLADEGSAPAADRRSALAAWQRRLHDAVDTRRSTVAPDDQLDAIVVAVAHTIQMFDLPMALFDDLISAFGQDTMTSRYDSWSDVLDYCRRSANPVGRLVLRIAGYRDEALDRSSDALCTALQLTNFWQDFGHDWMAGRLYAPTAVLVSCGASETDLSGSALNEPWMAVLDQCVAVTRQHFDAGRAVCDGVRGRLRYELRFTWLGGRRILEQVERTGARLLQVRPAIGRRDIPVLLWRTARWAARP